MAVVRTSWITTSPSAAPSISQAMVTSKSASGTMNIRGAPTGTILSASVKVKSDWAARWRCQLRRNTPFSAVANSTITGVKIT